MKKVLIIEASSRKGFSSEVARQIKDEMSKRAMVEVVELRNHEITRCKGCCACLSVGSSSCPLKDDDVKNILGKIEHSDGVIFVTPNYSLSVPGILKDLFDRLAFVFHRPRLFGKACLPVVVQGVYGGNKVAKYINEAMGFWGMQEVKGVVVSGGIYPKQGLKNDIMEKKSKAIIKALERFSKELENEKPVKPTLFKLMIFRMTRSSMKYFDEALEPDKRYFETKGWLDSDYYYEVEINPIKKLIGKFFDMMVRRMARKQVSNH
ncbi:MAG: NAD(P)H-dependent oxidoreductase [Dethiosulfatibacter sp.]|nr:NAD(P)H-dependent oxidoreductase [Dethiosulfatibacter sp.]